MIPVTKPNDALSFNGRTEDSDSSNGGSNPPKVATPVKGDRCPIGPLKVIKLDETGHEYGCDCWSCRPWTY